MGETGSDIADGGDDSDVGDELPRAAVSMISEVSEMALVGNPERVGSKRQKVRLPERETPEETLKHLCLRKGHGLGIASRRG